MLQILAAGGTVMADIINTCDVGHHQQTVRTSDELIIS